MRSQKATCSSANNVHGRVMIHQLFSPFPINGSFDTISFADGSIGVVDNDLSLLLRVKDRCARVLLCQSSAVSFLPTAFRIEEGGVGHHGVGQHRLARDRRWLKHANTVASKRGIYLVVVRQCRWHPEVIRPVVLICICGLSGLLCHLCVTLGHFGRKTSSKGDVQFQPA